MPGKPAAPTLTVGGDKQIDVEVTAPADGGAPITGYDTEFREFGITGWGTPGGAVPERTRSLRGLKPGQKYEVRVRAVNRRGAGPWSDFASATTTDSATLPGKPAAPTLTVGGDKQIDVEVTAPADGGAPITGYDTEFREFGITGWGTPGGAVPERTRSLRGLKPGQKYEVRVRAVNRRGPGPWSEFASATTTGAPVVRRASSSDVPVIATEFGLGDDDNLVVDGPPEVEVNEGETEVGAYVVEGAAEDATVAWSLDGADGSFFRIDGSGALAFRIAPDFADPADGDGDNVYRVTVKAAVDGGTPAGLPVRVKVVNVNEPPVFDADSYAFELAENRIGSVELGAVSATDPDEGDAVSYALVAGDTSLFEIDAASGVLSYIGPSEEYESAPNRYHLTVRAADGEGLSAEAGVTVTDEKIVTARARLRRVNETILPELSRAMVSGVVKSVSDRIEEARSGAAGEARVAIGGRPVRAVDDEVLEKLRRRDARDRLRGKQNAATMDWKEALRGTSFALPLGGEDGGGEGEGGSPGGPGAVTVWGGGDWRALSGGGGSLVEWDGDVAGARLGVDARLRDDLLAGLALNWSRGRFDWTDRGEAGHREMTGTHGSEMTSLHPYVGWWPGKDASLWASLGHGRGEVRIEDGEAGRQTADAALSTAAAGGRVLLFSGEDAIPGGTTSLALKGEAWLSRFEVEENGDRMAGLTVDTDRLRLGLEGAYDRRLARGGVLTPSLEVGLRHDGGDGETGLGVELGGGLAWRDPALGLTVEGWGRALAMHRGDIGKWGAGGSVRLDPGAAGLGPSLALRPSWGAGVDRLWEDGPGGPFARAAANDNAPSPAMGIEAELGYGLKVLGGHGVLTPYGGLSLSSGGNRSWRAAGRLAIGPSLSLGLEGERRESADAAPDHGVMLRATAQW